MPSLFFDFVGLQDASLEKNGWPIDALQSDRQVYYQMMLGVLFFYCFTFSILWFFEKSIKINLCYNDSYRTINFSRYVDCK